MAVAKLNEAERAKEEMENELKRKEQELQKRTRTRFQPNTDHDFIPMGVSHRGLGAFPRTDVTWRQKGDGTTMTLAKNWPPTSPPDQQVRHHDDAVLADGSTAQGNVEAVCSSCPSGTEELDNTPTSPVKTSSSSPSPDHQARDQHDAVVANGSTVPDTVEADCSSWPSRTEQTDSTKTSLPSSPPNHQVHDQHDEVTADGSTAPDTVETGRSSCSTETTGGTLPDVA